MERTRSILTQQHQTRTFHRRPEASYLLQSDGNVCRLLWSYCVNDG